MRGLRAVHTDELDLAQLADLQATSHSCSPSRPPLQAKVLKTIRIDKLDLGTVPPRVDCFKSFETGEDELIIEVRAPCVASGCG